MGTRSLIGKVEGKLVRTIYVHWDGASHLETLTKHYATEEKVDQLINLGGLSSLGERISPEDESQHHSFDKPVKGVCVAYHRDRGEDKEIDTIDYISMNYLTKEAKKYGAEFLYLFEDGEWKRFNIRG